jgi:hypothetical protein
MAALTLTEISTGALTKVSTQIFHVTAEVTATIEAAGYYNNLAIDSKVAPIGLLYHYDTAGKVTIYAYTHDGAVLTLITATALIPAP